MEKELNKKLSFLDIFLGNSSSNLKASIFHNKTFTGLLTNFNSFTSYSWFNKVFYRLHFQNKQQLARFSS